MEEKGTALRNTVIVFVIVLVGAILITISMLFTNSLKSTLPEENLHVNKDIDIGVARLDNYNVDETVEIYVNNYGVDSSTFVLYRGSEVVNSNNYTTGNGALGFYFKLKNNSYTVNWMQNG